MKLGDFINKYGDVQIDENELKEFLGIDSEKYFIPKEEDAYWLVTYSGNVTSEIHNNDVWDINMFENNEVFRTEKEAEEHARKQRFLLQMKRDFLDNSEEIDWEDSNQTKYYMYYNHTFSSVKLVGTWRHQVNIPLTTNRDWLEEYIEKYEEEIKKYYFGIKEEVK